MKTQNPAQGAVAPFGAERVEPGSPASGEVQVRGSKPMTTEEDHDRVMAIPSYRRWYDNCHEWRWAWERRRRHRADKMRAKAIAKHEAAMMRISEWERQHAGGDASYAAWQTINDRRYWSLRRV